MSIDIRKIRDDFPILHQEVYGKPYVYLDNAATTQKPLAVINALSDFYRNYNSNVHRGVHYLSQKATGMFEETRDQVKELINAAFRQEIIFTKGTTESVNFIAAVYGETFISQGDEIITTVMEHHSNLVPWKLMAEKYGAKVKYIPFNEQGVLDIAAYREALNDRTKLVAIGHVSNALGTIHPVKEMTAIAHEKNIPVMIDGAQATPHMNVDVRELDCDFYCFSAHKMYGPTGVGVLYGKKKWLEQLPPYQSGGEMIDSVTLEGVTFNELPYKFEAGTPNVADIVAYGAAIDYMQETGIENISRHEQELLHYTTEALSTIDGFKMYGEAPAKAGVISFLIGDIHPYDMGMIIDKMGIAVRTGHHCAQPVMEHFGIAGTVRASLGMYNTREDADHLAEAVKKAKKMLNSTLRL